MSQKENPKWQKVPTSIGWWCVASVYYGEVEGMGLEWVTQNKLREMNWSSKCVYFGPISTDDALVAFKEMNNPN